MPHPLIDVFVQPGLTEVRRKCSAWLTPGDWWSLKRAHPSVKIDARAMYRPGKKHWLRDPPELVWIAAAQEMGNRASTACFSSGDASEEIWHDVEMIPEDERGAVLEQVCCSMPCHAFVQQLVAKIDVSFPYYIESRSCCGFALQAIQFTLEHVEISERALFQLAWKSADKGRLDVLAHLLDLDEMRECEAGLRLLLDDAFDRLKIQLLQTMKRHCKPRIFRKWYEDQSEENRIVLESLLK